MATQIVPLSDSAYTLISSELDAFVQNISNTRIEIRFDDSLPDPTDKGHILKPEDVNGITKIAGVPAGNIYGKIAYTGRGGSVAVS